MATEPAESAGATPVMWPELRVAAVATRVNELLMVRSDGQWSTPAAVLRLGETLVEAAVRAVRDGCGLDALSGPSLGWYESIGPDPTDPDGHVVVMCFTVVVLDDDEPTAGAGTEEACWLPVWDVSELPLDDGLAALLAEHDIIDTLT